MKILERDTVPYEVATEILGKPGAHMSNRERKMFQKSRELHYVSEIECKPREDKLKFKFENCSWEQLLRWTRRIVARHVLLTKQVNALMTRISKLPETTDREKAIKLFAERRLAMVRVVLGNIAETRACLEREYDERSARASASNKIPVEDVSL